MFYTTPTPRTRTGTGTTRARADLQGLLYAAAGAEDGSVLCWRVSDHRVMFRHQASQDKMPASCLEWISSSQQQFLVVGTRDGVLLCIDIAGDLLAVMYLGCSSAVSCLAAVAARALVVSALDDLTLRSVSVPPLPSFPPLLSLSTDCHRSREPKHRPCH